MKTILGWQGGKTRLLPYIKQNLPSKFNKFYDLFVGGGSVFLGLEHKKTIINDKNKDLICLYRNIKDNYKNLIKEIENLDNIYLEKTQDEKKVMYLEIREKDRKKEWENATSLERAVRFQFLLRSCFNYTLRYNQKNEFNTAWNHFRGFVPFINDN